MYVCTWTLVFKHSFFFFLVISVVKRTHVVMNQICTYILYCTYMIRSYINLNSYLSSYVDIYIYFFFIEFFTFHFFFFFFCLFVGTLIKALCLMPRTYAELAAYIHI